MENSKEMLNSKQEKTWYNVSELQEFKIIIVEKLRSAKEELETLTNLHGYADHMQLFA
jgi:hypothetical protein